MHREQYKGKIISVDVIRRGEGWTWSYQIDSGPIRNSGDRPLDSEELMLEEAISEAKVEIDQME